MKTALAALFALGLAQPATARDFMSVHRDFDLGGARNLRVELPAGTLVVRAGAGDRIGARMTARCNDLTRECAERAEEVRLVSEPNGSTLVLKVEGTPRRHSRGFSIRLELEVPRSIPVSIEMGAGDIEVNGLEDDLDVHLGAGEADLHLPEHAVHKVRMGVGVGDVNLRRGRDHWDGKGFLSKHLHWTDGPGEALVDVDLGVGDIDIVLH